MLEKSETSLIVGNPTSPLIHSNNFVHFLLDATVTPSSESFARTLDIALFKPVAEHLYSERQEGFILNEQERQQLLDSRKEDKDVLNMSPQGRAAMEDLNKHTTEFANLQGVVERSSVSYIDPSTYMFEYTQANHGAYSECRILIGQILEEEKIPLLEDHTHPHNHLFSPIDYVRLLSSLDGEHRIVRAIRVLCPDMQLLALPTSDTPLLDIEEALKLVDEWDQEYTTDDDIQKKLTEKCERIMRYTFGSLVRIQKYGGERIIALDRASVGGQWSEAQLKESIDREVAEIRFIRDRIADEYERSYSTSFRALCDYSERKVNYGLIEFARDMALKLYISRDMQHYMAFSA